MPPKASCSVCGTLEGSVVEHSAASAAKAAKMGAPSSAKTRMRTSRNVNMVVSPRLLVRLGGFVEVGRQPADGQVVDVDDHVQEQVQADQHRRDGQHQDAGGRGDDLAVLVQAQVDRAHFQAAHEEQV